MCARLLTHACQIRAPADACVCAQHYAERLNSDGATEARLAALLDANIEDLFYTADPAGPHVGGAPHGKLVRADSGASPQALRGLEALRALLLALTQLHEADFVQGLGAVQFVEGIANHVAVKGGSEVEPLRFVLRKYAGQVPRVDLEFLTAAVLSPNAEADIKRLNPFLTDVSSETKCSTADLLVNVTTAFMLRLNRLGMVRRCMALTTELVELLRGLPAARPRAAIQSDPEEMRRMGDLFKQLAFKSASLGSALTEKRHSFTAVQAAAAGGELAYEPRYVVFEYLENLVLRNQQVRLLATFLNAAHSGASRVEQMIMGAGKTTVVGPLLALMLADGKQLVMQVVPSALLEFSRAVLRSRFTRVLPKAVHTLRFDRTVRRGRTLVRLHNKLLDAKRSRGVVVTTPEAVKSLFLKYLELQHQLEEAPPLDTLSESAQTRLQVCSLMADQLAQTVQLFRGGTLLLDEVDMLLHPLRSELNFPIGARAAHAAPVHCSLTC